MSRRGITVIEVMIASTVLTLAILGVLHTQAACRGLSECSRDTNLAVGDLRAAMEEILILPIEDIPDPSGPYAPGVPIARFTDLHLDGEQIVPTYPGAGGGSVPDPLEIVVTCTWNDDAGRTRRITFASQKTR